MTFLSALSLDQMNPGDLRVPYNLAQACAQKGLGKLLDCMERTKALPKTAFSQPKNRSTAKDQYNSLKIKPSLATVKDIMLIDDVITTGATALGAASGLKEIYPHANIKLFAAVRTISNPDKFIAWNEPCTNGIIKLLPNEKTQRNP